MARAHAMARNALDWQTSSPNEYGDTQQNNHS